MSTRSNIARLNQDGSVTFIYCHYDGYLEHNGKLLLNHYSDKDLVDQLMELGDLSSLRENIGTAHDFDDQSIDQCTFYGRDRGEDNIYISAKTCESLDKYLSTDTEEYCYIWMGDHWKYRTGYDLKHHVLSEQKECQ